MTCPVSGKIGYSSYRAAVKASASFHKRFKTNRSQDRTHAYYCRFCSQIHIGRSRKPS